MDSNESDDDDDDDDDGGDGMCRTAENLKVFCVSSTEYLKLTGKLKKDGPAEVGVGNHPVIIVRGLEVHFHWGCIRSLICLI